MKDIEDIIDPLIVDSQRNSKKRPEILYKVLIRIRCIIWGCTEV